MHAKSMTCIFLCIIVASKRVYFLADQINSTPLSNSSNSTHFSDALMALSTPESVEETSSDERSLAPLENDADKEQPVDENDDEADDSSDSSEGCE